MRSFKSLVVIASALIWGQLSFIAPLGAEEASTWRPHEHPATIQRSISGFTRPAAHLIVSSEDGGLLRSSNLEVGDLVEGADDWPVVAEMDPRLYRARLASARASLAETEALIVQLQREIARAQREQHWLEGEAERLAGLAAEGRASIREADELRFRADASQLQLAALEAQTQARQASRERAMAQVWAEELMLERQRLRAPRGWMVAERLLEPGGHAPPGTGILKLVRTDEWEIPLRLSEGELAALRTSEVQLQRRDGAQAVAQLFAVDPRFDPMSRKRLALLRLSQARDLSEMAPLDSGQEWILQLSLPDPHAGLRVPKAYLRQDLDQWLGKVGEGNWLRVTVLRQEGEDLIVHAPSLPDNLELLHLGSAANADGYRP